MDRKRLLAALAAIWLLSTLTALAQKEFTFTYTFPTQPVTFITTDKTTHRIDLKGQGKSMTTSVTETTITRRVYTPTEAGCKCQVNLISIERTLNGKPDSLAPWQIAMTGVTVSYAMDKNGVVTDLKGLDEIWQKTLASFTAEQRAQATAAGFTADRLREQVVEERFDDLCPPGTSVRLGQKLTDAGKMECYPWAEDVAAQRQRTFTIPKSLTLGRKCINLHEESLPLDSHSTERLKPILAGLGEDANVVKVSVEAIKNVRDATIDAGLLFTLRGKLTTDEKYIFEHPEEGKITFGARHTREVTTTLEK